MAAEHPYKNKSNEELVAECVRLNDLLKVKEELVADAKKKAEEKKPRVFRYWQAATLFFAVSFLGIIGCGYNLQHTVEAGHAEPLFISMGVFFGGMAIGFFVWGWSCVADHQLNDRFLPESN